ncbi:MAG: hypothetical protein HY725_02045 [Candidatus Rokubacteria bacterium]|nr:hypothetical protein [Candidatus Rokubacteria bacterium]
MNRGSGTTFTLTATDWERAAARAAHLEAERRRDPDALPYGWGIGRGRVLIRRYDYAVGRIRGKKLSGGRVRCAMLMVGCTGEMTKPHVYARLRTEFFADLLGRGGYPRP